jgi:hypothetical protein
LKLLSEVGIVGIILQRFSEYPKRSLSTASDKVGTADGEQKAS